MEKPLSSPHDHKEVTSILANERTYAAWIRTGLTALATGLILSHFLEDATSHFSAQIMASLLILCSVFCFVLAALRYRHVDARLTTASIFGIPVPLLIFSSILLVIVSFFALLSIL